MRNRIGIIGGGAAGLFAACQLNRLGVSENADVTLIEKNNIPGKKLTLTGHGRCNITNRKDASRLKEGYHEASKFIYPALMEFGPEDTVSFYENVIGLKVKEEDNNRIFPVCDSAVKVRDALVSYISDCSKILCGTEVNGISVKDGFEVATSKGQYHFDTLILSCGGSSFRETGSSGDSYRFAESLGHTVVPVRAALAPVNADKDSVDFCRALSGVSLDAGISLYCEGKKTASMSGVILFAGFGLTGPAVMEISREILHDVAGKDAYLELDLVPGTSDEEFDRKLLDLIGGHPDTKIATLLSGFVPQSVASAVTARTDCGDLYAQGFSKDNRKKICREMKHLRIRLKGAPDLNAAYVTRGGVSLKEVDRKTMESRLVPALYIIGEALDIDGISGGYNLQACMSEAYLAAKAILSKKIC